MRFIKVQDTAINFDLVISFYVIDNALVFESYGKVITMCYDDMACATNAYDSVAVKLREYSGSYCGEVT